MATKLLLLALGLAASFCTTAKTDSLPPINDLLHSLEIYYQKQTQAQLTEYQITEKGKWLKYIPNVSMGYNLGTSPEGNLKNILRPAISFNTNTLYQVRQDRAARIAKMQSIEQQLLLEQERDQQQLQQLLRQHRDLKEELHFLQKLQAIEDQLFEIASIQFENAALAPSAYLPKKRDYLQKQYSIFKTEQRLRDLEGTILQLVRVETAYGCER